MDPRKRQALSDRLAAALKTAPDHAVAVPLDEFLDGNDDDGSFAANTFGDLAEPMGILRQIAARPDVSAVYVEVVDAFEDDESSWPYSDRALIVTSAQPEEIAEHFGGTIPDDASIVARKKHPPGLAPIPPGQHLVGLWWD